MGKRFRFNLWVGKILWRRAWQPTPVLLPGESHGRRSLAGYSPRGHKESDTTERLSTHTLTPRLMSFWGPKPALLLTVPSYTEAWSMRSHQDACRTGRTIRLAPSLSDLDVILRSSDVLCWCNYIQEVCFGVSARAVKLLTYSWAKACPPSGAWAALGLMHSERCWSKDHLPCS